MYHHPGEYVTDFCITRHHDGVYHLFHIRGERWTWPLHYREIDLGHAISHDLRQWTPQAPVIPVGPPGAWDQNGVWAPDIIERDGVYYIFYTGSDVKANQQIGIATSTDLYHWEKHPANPVVAPGPWSDRARGEAVAGRDAMVYADGDRYLMYYTATMADGRACIALAESHDLIHWEDRGPTYIENDRRYNRCESAYVVRHGDLYYLFYSAKGGPQSKGHAPSSFDHFDIVYLISDNPTGGWRRPANHELLTEWTCASEHPTFDGETYMFYVVQETVDDGDAGIWGASVLSDPKRITWRDDGTVKVVEHLPANVTRTPLYRQAQGHAGWVALPQPWTVDAAGDWHAPAAEGEAVLVNPLWGRDVTLEAQFHCAEGAVASLLVRGNPSGSSGYRVALDPGAGTISLYRRLFQRPERLLQQRRLPLAPEAWHTLKVVVQDKFLDVYVDDELWLVRADRTFEDGCFGVHAMGAVTVRGLDAGVYAGPPDPSAMPWTHQAKPRHLFP